MPFPTKFHMFALSEELGNQSGHDLGINPNRGHFNFRAPPWRPDRAKIWTICWTLILLHMDFSNIWTCRLNQNSFTLKSGIDAPPGMTVDPPLKNVHIRILIRFYINQDSAVIFLFLFFSKIDKSTSTFTPDSRVPHIFFWKWCNASPDQIKKPNCFGPMGSK